MLKNFLKAIGYNGVIGVIPLFLFLFTLLFPAYIAFTGTSNLASAFFAILGGMKLNEFISKGMEVIYKNMSK